MNAKRHRRSIILLLIVMVLALGITPAVHAQNSTSNATLNWSVEGISELSTLNPAKGNDSQSFLVMDFIYGKLVKLDKLLRVTPDLAQDWKISDDGLTYTFTLKDVKFSDGSPITADDITFSIQYALDPKVGGSNGSFYLSSIVGVDDFVNGKATSISGVSAPDSKTVVFKIQKPSAVFLNQLTFGFRVISKKQVTSNKNWDQNPVASGGFMLKEWNHNKSITIVPNPGYWDKPTVTINFIFNQDSEVAYQSYMKGQLDIMGSQQNGVPASHIEEAQALPDFLQAANFATRYVGFNNAHPPFDNVNVRRAFALAIDKQKLVKKDLGGNAVLVADRILPTGIPGSELPIKPLTFDPDAAKKALADSGVSKDALSSITITYGMEGDNEHVLTILADMWQENLGIKVKLVGMDLGKFSDGLTVLYKDPKASDIEMYYSIWGADYPDPQNFLSQQLRTDVGNNNGHWSDKKFDSLVDKADVLTDDDSTRYQLYQEAEQIAIDEVGWLPIFYPRTNVLLKPGTQGLFLTGNGLIAPVYANIKPSE